MPIPHPNGTTLEVEHTPTWEDLPIETPYKDVQRRASEGVVAGGQYTNCYFATSVPEMTPAFKAHYHTHKAKIDKGVESAVDYYRTNAFFILNEAIME